MEPMPYYTDTHVEPCSHGAKPAPPLKQGGAILSRSSSAPSISGKPQMKHLNFSNSVSQTDHRNLSSPTCVGVDAHGQMRECTMDSKNGHSAFPVKPQFPSSRASSNSSASRRSDPCSAPDTPPSVEDTSPYNVAMDDETMDISIKPQRPMDNPGPKEQVSGAESEKNRWYPPPVWMPPPANSSSSLLHSGVPPHPATPDPRPSYPSSRALTPHSVVSSHAQSNVHQHTPWTGRYRSRTRTNSTVSFTDDGWDTASHVSTHSLFQSNQLPNYSFATDDFFAYPQPASGIYKSFWTSKQKRRDLDFFWNPASMLRTCLSFVWWISAINLHQQATRRLFTWGTTIHPNFVMEPPLHDYIHETVPSLQAFRIIPEILHTLPIVIFALSIIRGLDAQALDAFRTFICCHGLLMLLRALSFSSTLLPDASRQCMTSFYVGSCFDLIFSGHAMIMSLSLFALFHFYPYLLNQFKKALLCFHVTCVGFLIVAVRNHYTIDVVIGMLVAPLFLRFWVTSPFLSNLSMTNSPFHLREQMIPASRLTSGIFTHRPVYYTRSRGNSAAFAPTPISTLPGTRRKDSASFAQTPSYNTPTQYAGSSYTSPSFRTHTSDDYSLHPSNSTSVAYPDERPPSRIASLLHHLRQRRGGSESPFMSRMLNRVVPMAVVNESIPPRSPSSVSSGQSSPFTTTDSTDQGKGEGDNDEVRDTTANIQNMDDASTCTAREMEGQHTGDASDRKPYLDILDHTTSDQDILGHELLDEEKSLVSPMDSEAMYDTGSLSVSTAGADDVQGDNELWSACPVGVDDIDGTASYGTSDADSDPKSIPSSL